MGMHTLIQLAISAIIALPVIVGLVLVHKVFVKGQTDSAELMISGAAAEGRIVQAQMGMLAVRTGVHRHVPMQLVVDVYPQTQGHYRGQAQPWRAQFTQVVRRQQAAQLQPGAHVYLRYDPQNPQRVTLSGVAVGMKPLASGSAEMARIAIVLGALVIALLFVLPFF